MASSSPASAHAPSRAGTTCRLAWADIPRFADYDAALVAVRPDVVSINTWPDTHAAYALQALEAGAHVFVEKPLAETIADAQRVVAAACANRRKLVVGYILRHHPSWIRLVDLARTLGKPLAMRMNLNQQSVGETWTWHKNLMRSLPPIVDCGVHYVDVMCQITGAAPRRVHGIGARLSDEVAPAMYNYGQLQVEFDDGSVGWYEAGWGPMISEVAFFVKDVIGPKGAVSIVMAEQNAGSEAGAARTVSSDIATHSRTSAIRLHHAALQREPTRASGNGGSWSLHLPTDDGAAGRPYRSISRDGEARRWRRESHRASGLMARPRKLPNSTPRPSPILVSRRYFDRPRITPRASTVTC